MPQRVGMRSSGFDGQTRAVRAASRGQNFTFSLSSDFLFLTFCAFSLFFPVSAGSDSGSVRVAAMIAIAGRAPRSVRAAFR